MKKRGRKHRSPSPPSPKPSTLSFFKIMIGDFKDVLYIPPMAARALKDLNKKYIYIEDANRKYWEVEISMVGGFLAFQEGWDTFLSAHSITAGEFVLFTYTGGLIFTARIFGTSSLERVDFQMKKKRGKCAKEGCTTDTTELKLEIVRPSKKKKASHASEVKQSPPDNEPLRLLRRGRGAAHLDSPKVQMVESVPINGVLKIPSSCGKPFEYDSNSKEYQLDSPSVPICGVLKIPSSCGKPLEYDSNSKESENVRNDSEQKLYRNVDDTFEEENTMEEQNKISPTEQAKSGTENIGIGISLVSKQEEDDTMTKCAALTFEPHSDIKEENNLHGLEMLETKPPNDNMVALSNLKHVESSQLDFNKIEPDGIVDEVVHKGDEICNTLDEKVIELATESNFDVNDQEELICQNGHESFCSEISVPLKTISVFSSNSIVICTSNKKENLKPANGECGDSQITGIGHDAFIDEDEKDDTPFSSCRSRTITERRDSVDLPSSSCVSFSICLSNDDQSSLEVPPKQLASLMGKLKKERKIAVLQDLSMKCWPVLYHENLNFTGFIGGWMDFARANNICRGDICEFDLVNKTELKFQVRITKHEQKVEDGQIG